jgi:hypothetical protein
VCTVAFWFYQIYIGSLVFYIPFGVIAECIILPYLIMILMKSNLIIKFLLITIIPIPFSAFQIVKVKNNFPDVEGFAFVWAIPMFWAFFTFLIIMVKWIIGIIQ